MIQVVIINIEPIITNRIKQILIIVLILGTFGSSKASSMIRSIVNDVKFKVDKFDGTNRFNKWQCEMMNGMLKQDFHVVSTKDKPDDMYEGDW